MIEGTPLTQQADVGVISNLSSSSNNASETILKSAINRDAILPSMSQEMAKKLVAVEKIYMKLAQCRICICIVCVQHAAHKGAVSCRGGAWLL
jgi:hypothetical protein